MKNFVKLCNYVETISDHLKVIKGSFLGNSSLLEKINKQLKNHPPQSSLGFWRWLAFVYFFCDVLVSSL